MWDTVNTEERCLEICPCSERTRKVRKFNKMQQPDDLFADKENMQDLSLYGDISPPLPICTGTSPSHCSRRLLDDHDANSQDSGYGASENRRYRHTFDSPTSKSNSFGSLCSMEDAFLEDFSDVEPLDKQQNLPQDFNKLINGPISATSNKTSPKLNSIRPLFRRALSLQTNVSTPGSSRIRSCLFKTNVVEVRCIKRQSDAEDEEDTTIKRSKLFEDVAAVPEVPIPRPLLKRPFSATEESIKCALQRSSTEPDLIGDYSKNFLLPLTHGRHQDMKAITPITLARLMRGDFSEAIESYKVIDCRYPYEFDGGHIEGAVNIYTKEQCLELLTTEMSVQSQKRHILVFHCEFSSERGPNLYRYLRQEDRLKNENLYPQLNYPEMYLLEGGYKKFFEQFSNMCEPIAYKEMLHPDHENDLRHFRQKSKTWNMDTRQRSQRSKRLI